MDNGTWSLICDSQCRTVVIRRQLCELYITSVFEGRSDGGAFFTLRRSVRVVNQTLFIFERYYAAELAVLFHSGRLNAFFMTICYCGNVNGM